MSNRLLDEGASRLLLNDVVDGLQRADWSSANCLKTLLDPTNCWPECNANLADLSISTQILECGPEVVIKDWLNASVVELVKIDVLDSKAF